MARRARPRSVGRARGRPVGADSAETRARILRAARHVINERGWDAATFQAIAEHAELSRPAVHYYFDTREEIFDRLVDDARALITEWGRVAAAEDSLLAQLSAFVTAALVTEVEDRSVVAFLINSRFEQSRHPRLRARGNAGVSAFGEFLAALVHGAIAREELSADTDVAETVALLRAMFWGVGFYAGFADHPVDLARVAEQLNRLFAHGLQASPPDLRRGSPAPPAQDTQDDTPGSVGLPP